MWHKPKGNCGFGHIYWRNWPITSFHNFITLSHSFCYYYIQYIVCKIFCISEVKLINPFPADPGQRENSNLNFHFHTSLWYLKRFYEGLKGKGKRERLRTGQFISCRSLWLNLWRRQNLVLYLRLSFFLKAVFTFQTKTKK